jgi:hypothetical protein
MSGDKSKCLIFFSGFIIGFVFGTTYYNKSITNDSPTNDSEPICLNTKECLKIFYDPAPRNCV